MWRDLAGIGRCAATGGYRRHAWTSADAECREWFREQALVRGLVCEVDRNGNQWAWAGDPEAGDAVVTGSHLDSVPDGGAFDGPLGVVSAFAALDRLRERGTRLRRPLAIAHFADEEGARFGVACVGSRLATGRLGADEARRLTDADGTTLAQAMEAAGYDPGILGPDPGRLARIGAFVELHIEQGRALDLLGAPVGVARGIRPHGRWRFDFRGVADHAGTTRLADRHDPMLPYAETVLAARGVASESRNGSEGEGEDQGEGGSGGDTVATFGKVTVEPNGVNAVPGLVRAWLDARTGSEAALRALVARIEEAAREHAARHGVEVGVVRESLTPAVEFDGTLRDRVVRVLGQDGRVDIPVLGTGAGHDAGILAGSVPAAMLFVRNPTGVSHSPAEHATEEDCAAGVRALADVLEGLTRS